MEFKNHLSILEIPEDKFHDYCTDVMFEGYKWDMQMGKQATLTNKVLKISEETFDFLKTNAIGLYRETMEMEKVLKGNTQALMKMGMSQRMADTLNHAKHGKSVRFMRFDFHPTTDGWQVSEVNADVPAGYPDASILPDIALRYLTGLRKCGCFSDPFIERFSKIVPKGQTIAFVHDTHTVEDYQILRYLADLFEKRGYKSVFEAPENLRWKGEQLLDVGAIFRYYPVEWLEFIKGMKWQKLINCQLPCSNPPTALFTQSKRLPLVWDELGKTGDESLDFPYWYKLLPETECPTTHGGKKGWILKPAFGRVGEGINVTGCVTKREDEAIRKAAAQEPLQWVAQKQFESVSIDGFHVGIGAFVIDGEFGGCFARLSSKNLIDEKAIEVPVLY